MSRDLRGVLHWAVVPYTPAEPFEADLDDSGEWLHYETALDLREAAKSLPGPYWFAVEGKIRPVVVISNPLPVEGGLDDSGLGSEYTALRLSRIRHSDGDFNRIRDQEEPLLFHLKLATSRGLSRRGAQVDGEGRPFDYAVMLNALVRLHETALVGLPGGQLDENEYRVVCRRLVDMLGLDLRGP